MFTKLVVASVLAAGALAQDQNQPPKINTPPSITQCQPVQLTWENGKPPYIIDVIPGGQTSAQALEVLGKNINAMALTWFPDLADGTSINFRITDNAGRPAYSDVLSIVGGSTDCLNKTSTGGDNPNVSIDGAAANTGGAGSSDSAASTGAPASASSASSDAAGTTPGAGVGAGSAAPGSSGASNTAASNTAGSVSSTAGSSSSTGSANPTGTPTGTSGGSASAPATTTSQPAGASALNAAVIPALAMGAVALVFAL